jgi:hypothetical protein
MHELSPRRVKNLNKINKNFLNYTVNEQKNKQLFFKIQKMNISFGKSELDFDKYFTVYYFTE